MNTTMKWLLIAGGAAYLLREQLLAALGVAAAAAPAATISAPAAPAPTTAAASTTQQTTYELIASYAAAHGFALMNYDQWNWVYQQVRGTTGPDISQVFPAQDRARVMTLDEWWTGVTAAGLSGVTRRRAAPRTWAGQAWGY